MVTPYPSFARKLASTNPALTSEPTVFPIVSYRKQNKGKPVLLCLHGELASKTIVVRSKANCVRGVTLLAGIKDAPQVGWLHLTHTPQTLQDFKVNLEIWAKFEPGKITWFMLVPWNFLSVCPRRSGQGRSRSSLRAAHREGDNEGYHILCSFTNLHLNPSTAPEALGCIQEK